MNQLRDLPQKLRLKVHDEAHSHRCWSMGEGSHAASVEQFYFMAGLFSWLFPPTLPDILLLPDSYNKSIFIETS